jgi:hypothetical protein
MCMIKKAEFESNLTEELLINSYIDHIFAIISCGKCESQEN